MSMHFVYLAVVALLVGVFNLPEPTFLGIQDPAPNSSPPTVTYRNIDGICNVTPEGNMNSPAWLPRCNVTNENMAGRTFQVNVSWAYGPIGDPGFVGNPGPRVLMVNLDSLDVPVSRWLGVCCNWGANGNMSPDFQVATIQNVQGADPNINSQWEVLNAERTLAQTRNPIQSGQVVPLFIASFDGGAECHVVATGNRLGPRGLPVPLDTDNDHLPDNWENGK